MNSKCHAAMKYAIRIANAPFPVWIEAIYPDQLGKPGPKDKYGLGASHFYTDFLDVRLYTLLFN